MSLRHVLATCAVSALALGGTALPSASAFAAEASCDDPAALASAVTQAQTDVVAAKQALRAANRPMGRLVAARRHEAHAELKLSRTELRSLRTKSHQATPAERKALRVQKQVERRDIAEARNLLTVKRSLLAAIKADRHAAKQQLVTAKAALAQLNEIAAGC